MTAIADKAVMHARPHPRPDEGPRLNPEQTRTLTPYGAEELTHARKLSDDVVDPYNYYGEPDETVEWQLRLIFASIEA